MSPWQIRYSQIYWIERPETDWKATCISSQLGTGRDYSVSDDHTDLCVLSSFSHVWLFATLWTRAHQAPLSMGILQARLGVGCHALFQGIFPTQGLNPCLLLLLHCRQILYHWATREAPHRSLEPEKSEKWTLLHNIHQVNFKWSK